VSKKILIHGYGNPGREDDGLGPELAERIEKLEIEGVATDADYQLNIEDAVALSEYDIVLFVDASREDGDRLTLRRVKAAPEIAFTSHSVSPESILAICEDHFQASPETWLLGIAGYSFEMAEGLTPRARENLEDAVKHVQSMIKRWKEQL
jgi:hydrogenase maturation protease